MQNIYDLTDRMFIDPTNPKTQFKVLRMLGLEDLMPDYSKVVKRALYENEQIKNGNYDKIEVRDFDDHKIHFNIHIQVYNSDMFMDWEDEKQKFMIDHLNGHHQQIQKQAEMEMEKMRYLNNMKGESGGNGLKGGMPLQNTSGQGAPAGLEGQPV